MKTLIILNDPPYGTERSYNSRPGELDAPAGVAVDDRGRLYVADITSVCSCSIPRVDSSGSTDQPGRKGIRAGHLKYPTDVALLPDGSLFVADA